MQEKINNLLSQLGAVVLSMVSFAEGYDWLGIITALLGATLTAITIWEKYESIQLRRIERKKAAATLEGE
jgi:CHASE2 domain-containing sensor protein